MAGIAAAGVWPGGGGGGADEPQPTAAMAATQLAQHQAVREVIFPMVMRRFLNKVFQNTRGRLSCARVAASMEISSKGRPNVLGSEFVDSEDDGVSTELWQAVVWQLAMSNRSVIAAISPSVVGHFLCGPPWTTRPCRQIHDSVRCFCRDWPLSFQFRILSPDVAICRGFRAFSSSSFRPHRYLKGDCSSCCAIDMCCK